MWRGTCKGFGHALVALRWKTFEFSLCSKIKFVELEILMNEWNLKFEFKWFSNWRKFFDSFTFLVNSIFSAIFPLSVKQFQIIFALKPWFQIIFALWQIFEISVIFHNLTSSSNNFLINSHFSCCMNKKWRFFTQNLTSWHHKPTPPTVRRYFNAFQAAVSQTSQQSKTFSRHNKPIAWFIPRDRERKINEKSSRSWMKLKSARHIGIYHVSYAIWKWVFFDCGCCLPQSRLFTGHCILLTMQFSSWLSFEKSQPDF